MIPGKGSVVGERFVTHPLVRKVCFTGSTAVGKRIMAGCADQVKRCTLELGGKSANVIFADADLRAAAAAAPYAVFDNAGQDCCARSRILVERSAYDEFLGLLEPAVQGAGGARPGGPQQRDGAADLGAPARRRAGVRRRGRRRVHRPGAGRAGLLGAADRGARRLDATSGSGARRCSGRWSRCCRSTTRRTRSRWPTTPSTACPARSSPATSAGRCGSRAASRPATSR